MVEIAHRIGGRVVGTSDHDPYPVTDIGKGLAASLRFAWRRILPGIVMLAVGVGCIYLALRGAEGMAAGERAPAGQALARGVLSPDGVHVAILRDDGAVEVAPVGGGPGVVVRGHGSPVIATRFSPDGASLITVDASGATLNTYLGGLGMEAAALRAAAHGAGSPEAVQALVWNNWTQDAWRTGLSLESRWSPASGAGNIMSPEIAAPLLASGAVPAPGTMFRDCADCPQMVVIPAGRFTMGSPAEEAGRYDDEGPQREVTIASPFAAGRFEVTIAEFSNFVAASGHVAAGNCNADPDGDGTFAKTPEANWRKPGFAQSPAQPVLCVSWEDAQAYATWLSRETGEGYRLLSEAEWEYAARATTSTAYPWGATASHEKANYGQDEGGKGLASGRDQWVNTAPVGSFDANRFGFYDMHGNAWEWVADCFEDNYSAGQPPDGSAYQGGSCSFRVIRGGSWFSYPQFLRSASRNWFDPSFRLNFLGFRVARTL